MSARKLKTSVTYLPLSRHFKLAKIQAAAYHREYGANHPGLVLSARGFVFVMQNFHHSRAPKFGCYRTNFHGERLVSRHHTEAAAVVAAERQRTRDCHCGGCAIVVRLDQA